MPTAHDACSLDDTAYRRQAGSEPIPGYRLLEPLGRGGFGEVWKCEAPGGLHKAIKFVHGQLHVHDGDAAEMELRGVRRIKKVRHPFLLSIERVEVVANELIIVFELADHNLAEVCRVARQEGRPGIARDLLLRYMSEAAEALDVLHNQHHLQHLDVKPENLFLVSDHVKVGDFGLVHSLTAGDSGSMSGQRPSAITAKYAAPEIFEGNIGPNADQYSLAIVYQELLTGAVPFAGKNFRQLMMEHAKIPPDLSRLPEGDRPIVARALAKIAAERFPSCTDFINALFTGEARLVAVPSHASLCVEEKPDAPARTERSAATLLLDGDEEVPHFRFATGLPPEVARMRLDSFRRQWDAKAVPADIDGLVLHMEAPCTFWQRWTGRLTRLEVRLRVVADNPVAEAGKGVQVWLSIFPRDCGVGEATRLLSIVGPLLAESVRTHLQLNPRTRSQERLPWRHPLHLCPILPNGSLGPARECQGKDISLNGIGFYVPGSVAITEVMLLLPETTLTACVSVRARIVRSRACADGWHEVGAILNAPQERAKSHEAPVTVPSPQVRASRRWQKYAAAILALVAVAAGGAAGVLLRPPGPGAAETLPVIKLPRIEVVGVAEEVEDLQDAIHRAPVDGVIRIHGEVRSRPVQMTGKALKFQGVAGTSPALVRLPAEERRWEPFLASDAPLVIEGLELRGNRDDLTPLATVTSDSLTLRHCKLFAPMLGPALALRRGRELRMEECDLQAVEQGVAIEVAGQRCRVTVRESQATIRAARGALLLAWSNEGEPAVALEVDLSDSRVEAGRVLACRTIPGPVRVTARGNQLTLRQTRFTCAGYRNATDEPAVRWHDADGSVR